MIDSHDYSLTAEKKETYINIVHFYVITGSDMGWGLSFTQQSEEGRRFSAVCRCNARNMNQKK